MKDTDEEFLRRTKVHRIKLQVPEFRHSLGQTITLEQWKEENGVHLQPGLLRGVQSSSAV